MDILDLIKKEGLRRGMSHRAIRTYIYCVKKFLLRSQKDPLRVTKKDIRDYLDALVEKGASGNTLNVHLSALAFFFEHILSRRLLLNLKYSKKPKHLPVVLSQEEVSKLFTAIPNKKHELLVMLMYGAGLRVSEAVSLKVRDLEMGQSYGWVRKGKGNKDRIFVIAEGVKEPLRQHIISARLQPENWLFPGRKGNHLHQRSVASIMKQAAKKAGIIKNVHPHTLRHSFATHLIENGYDVASVQSLLGHSSMDATMVYLHLAPSKMMNVKSPLDTLEKREQEPAKQQKIPEENTSNQPLKHL